MELVFKSQVLLSTLERDFFLTLLVLCFVYLKKSPELIKLFDRWLVTDRQRWPCQALWYSAVFWKFDGNFFDLKP